MIHGNEKNVRTHTSTKRNRYVVIVGSHVLRFGKTFLVVWARLFWSATTQRDHASIGLREDTLTYKEDTSDNRAYRQHFPPVHGSHVESLRWWSYPRIVDTFIWLNSSS